MSKKSFALIIGSVWLAVSLGVGWLGSKSQNEPDLSDLIPQAPRDYHDVRTNFSPEQEISLIPLIKRLACVRAEMAVRHHLKPEPVLLPTCGVEDKTEIDTDLINVTVAGIAKLTERECPFTVTLEHYPPSVSITGYIVISIDAHC
jgi:hypothetical protein